MGTRINYPCGEYSSKQYKALSWEIDEYNSKQYKSSKLGDW